MIKRLLLLVCLPLLAHIYADDLSQWSNSEGIEIWVDPVLKTTIFHGNQGNFVVPDGTSFGILDGRDKFSIPGISFDTLGLKLTDEGRKFILGLIHEANPPESSAKKIVAIVIDAGHGGKDPGAIGTFDVNGKKTDLREKDITLSTALKVASQLRKKFPGKQILLTRTKDEFLSLEERAKFANEHAKSRQETILFISIHANSSLNSKASGHEIWYLPPESRRQIVKKSEFNTDKDLANIINNLIEEELTVESFTLAQSVQKGMINSVGKQSESRGIKQEEWYVVRKSFMPAILIELGFVTNKEEFNLMRTEAYLQNLADGIYSGISNFVEDYENDHH